MSDKLVIDGTLERRKWMKWTALRLQLSDGTRLSVLEKNGKPKEQMEIEHLERLASNQKGEELAFALHFRERKKDKMVLRTQSSEEFELWVNTIVKALEKAGASGVPNCGLPPNDPRTDLPLITIPAEFVSNFGYLNMAVVHWFGVVKKLGDKFSVEDRIAVLGDRCLYLCKRNADITRCIMVADIKKLLLAQDDAKDLYIAIIMPETIENTPGKDGEKTERVEYDMMFHTSDIQNFVRYLRTVYVYQTLGKMLPLEQVKDKRQLETDVRLARPKGWELTYWQPMYKEHLAKLLEAWQAQQKEGAQQTAAEPATRQQAAIESSQPAAPAAPAQTTVEFDDGNPLGKFLVMISLSKYYNVMVSNKMNLEMLVTGLIDDSDLKHFGVESDADRAKIIQALQDKDLIDRLTDGAVSKTGQFNPPKPVPADDLDSDYANLKPKLAADDDLDLDLDLDAPAAPAANLGGGADFDLDLDLDDFGPVAAPSGPAMQFDDLDLDLGPSPAKGGAVDDLDLDDLDLAPAKPSGGGVALDDLDDLSVPAKPAPAVDDLDLDL